MSRRSANPPVNICLPATPGAIDVRQAVSKDVGLHSVSSFYEVVVVLLITRYEVAGYGGRTGGLFCVSIVPLRRCDLSIPAARVLVASWELQWQGQEVLMR